MRRDLVARARGGDREAFATLAADSIGRLFNLALLMLRDRDLADDAVQEALVLAWRDLRGLRDLDGFDAWLRRVLVRCVYREAERERRRSARAVQIPVECDRPRRWAAAFSDPATRTTATTPTSRSVARSAGRRERRRVMRCGPVRAVSAARQGAS